MKNVFAYLSISGPNIKSFKDNGFYPVDAILASLFKIRAKLADQPAFKFPPVGRLALFLNKGTKTVYSTDNLISKKANTTATLIQLKKHRQKKYNPTSPIKKRH